MFQVSSCLIIGLYVIIFFSLQCSHWYFTDQCYHPGAQQRLPAAWSTMKPWKPSASRVKPVTH